MSFFLLLREITTQIQTMAKRFRFNHILLLLSGMLFFSCQNKNTKENSAENYISFKDYYGRDKQIKKQPQRIVSLSPGITELLFDLGQGERLVGRTDFCIHPPQAEKIKSMGGISDASLEMIVASQPDIVFTASMVSKQMVERMEDLGLNVVCLPERSKISDVYETVGLLGRIFGKEQLCDSLIDGMKQSIAEIEKQIPQGKRPIVYYVVGFGDMGDYTAGGNTFINDIITLAGGENMAKDLDGWSIGKEVIFARQPDFIIVRKEDLKRFVSTSPYNKLKAVKENKVMGIESSLTDCQTLRSIEAIKQISDFIKSNK